MLLDKHEKKHKGYLAIMREYNELLDQKYKAPWIPVDKPYQDGWTLNIELRDDIKRRSDASILQEALSLVAMSSSTKNPKVVSKIRQLRKLHDVQVFMTPTKRAKYSSSLGSAPQLSSLNVRNYEKINPKLQHLFYKWTDHSSVRWGGTPVDKYSLNLPYYYFVVKVKPAIVTHTKRTDPKVEKRIAEIQNKMGGKWGLYYGRRSSWDRAEYNKYASHIKSEEKVAINKILKGETEDFEPRIKHKL
jgi:hypothetical protein